MKHFFQINLLLLLFSQAAEAESTFGANDFGEPVENIYGNPFQAESSFDTTLNSYYTFQQGIKPFAIMPGGGEEDDFPIGGDDDDPNVYNDAPTGDVLLPLSLFALAYAFLRKRRRRVAQENSQ